jgi:hypothetical protein
MGYIRVIEGPIWKLSATFPGCDSSLSPPWSASSSEDSAWRSCRSLPLQRTMRNAFAIASSPSTPPSASPCSQSTSRAISSAISAWPSRQAASIGFSRATTRRPVSRNSASAHSPKPSRPCLPLPLCPLREVRRASENGRTKPAHQQRLALLGDVMEALERLTGCQGKNECQDRIRRRIPPRRGSSMQFQHRAPAGRA